MAGRWPSTLRVPLADHHEAAWPPSSPAHPGPARRSGRKASRPSPRTLARRRCALAVEHHLLAAQLVLPDEVVRGVVPPDRSRPGLRTPSASRQPPSPPGTFGSRIAKFAALWSASQNVSACPRCRSPSGSTNTPLAGCFSFFGVDLLHHVPVVPAAEVPDAHRPRVNHHRHGARLQPPGVRDRAVEYLLDPFWISTKWLPPPMLPICPSRLRRSSEPMKSDKPKTRLAGSCRVARPDRAGRPRRVPGPAATGLRPDHLRGVEHTFKAAG